jgi:glycosyltransferase involved in cell wall biosynthesis
MEQKYREKLLIFIVAYNAEKHIESVLDRIPKVIFEKYDYEILMIDDSSKDRTFEIAHAYQNINQSLNLKVLFNPVNQGYGGNQKLGYEYAIQNDFDVVVLLHGDGQYAPEILGDMVNPLFSNEADAVFGSRMMVKGHALGGGMPLYKYLGNKILTWIQNKILGSSLSEFHSGYRAYSVKALKEIPFKRNSNDFHFDTQIIIQLLLAEKIIKEIPIPTYYGDEICNVDGMKYGWHVILSTLSSKLHNLSIFYKREYDITKPLDKYPLKLGYLSSHTLAIKNVQANSKVLDIGGGQGLVAKELKTKGCSVTGLDKCQLESDRYYDLFHQEDLDFIKFDFDLPQYDTILMLDIIEHLANPEEFLDKLRAKSGLNQPRIIVTTPNIAFWITRMQLLLGQFNYGKQGILDMTHKRLFTFKTMKKLFDQCDYKVTKVKGIPAPFPKAIGLNFASRFLIELNKWLIWFSKSLFSYQIYMEVQPTPVVEVLLDHSVSESKKRKDLLNQVPSF